MRNPYVGLRPFFTEDSLYFFGRDAQVAEVLDLLKRSRFLSVVGSSGSGKSSLIRAGLIPSLLGGFLVSDRDQWRVASIRPGSAPLRNLAGELRRAMGDADDPAADDALRARLLDGGVDEAAELLAALGPHENLLILADQFEEIFAFRGSPRDEAEAGVDPIVRREELARREEAAAYVDLLLKLSQSDLPVYVVLTMRTDFLGDCDLFYGLPEAMNQSQYLVPRLSRQELREAIQGPPALSRVKVAPRLLDQLLNDLGDRFDRLPLLQHALLLTWEKWEATGGIGPIDQDHFNEAGGLENALSKDAAAALAEATSGPSAVPLDVVARIFKQLTDTDLSKRRVRRPARRSELMATTGASREAVDYVVECFNKNGRSFLFVASDGMPEDPRVDISHESLIRQWDTLRTWVDEERDARDGLLDLADRARRRRVLLQEQDLAGAREWKEKADPTPVWAARYGVDFAAAMAYLAASEQADANRIARRRARKRNSGIAVGAVVVVLIVLLLQQHLVVAAGQRASIAHRLSLVKELAESDPMAAAFLAVDLPHVPPDSLQRVDLLRRIAEASVPRAEFHDVNDISYDPRSERVVLARDSGVIEVRRADGTDRGFVLRADTAEVQYVSFVAGGTRLLTSSCNGVVRLWKSDGTSNPLAEWRTGQHICAVAALSRDNKFLLVWGDSGVVSIWRATPGGAAVARFSSITFVDPSGEDRVAMTSGDSVAVFQLGQLEKGVHWTRIRSARLEDLALSPGGDRFLTLASGAVTIYDVSGRSQPIELHRGLDDSSFSAASFGRDGHMVVTGSRDGRVDSWHAATGKWVKTLGAHEGVVSVVEFDQKGDLILSCGGDNTVRIWGADVPSVLRGHRNTIETAQFNDDDGLTLVTRDADRVARLWNSKPTRGYSSVDGRLWASARFSSDGRRLILLRGDTMTTIDLHTGARHSFVGASCGATPSVSRTICATESGYLLRDLSTGDSLSAVSVPFRPGWLMSSDDGGRIASLGQDSTVRVFDVTTGKIVFAGRYDYDGQPPLLAFNANARMFAINGRSPILVSIDSQRTTKLHVSDTTRFGHGRAGFVRFSGRGELATVYDDGVLLWKTDGPRPSVDSVSIEVAAKWPDIFDVVFSHDGKRLIVLDGSWLPSIWRVDGSRNYVELRGHERPVNSAVWSSDDRLVATGSMDNTVRVWAIPRDSTTRGHDPRSPRTGISQSLVLRAEPIDMGDVAFTDSGSRVVGLTRKGSIFSWLINPDSLTAQIKASTNACLTDEFRTAFLGESPEDAEKNFESCKAAQVRPDTTKVKR